MQLNKELKPIKSPRPFVINLNSLVGTSGSLTPGNVPPPEIHSPAKSSMKQHESATSSNENPLLKEWLTDEKPQMQSRPEMVEKANLVADSVEPMINRTLAILAKMENNDNRRLAIQVEKKLYTKLIAEINDDKEIRSKVTEFKLKRRQEMN